ncbi:GNAT family protein [Rarobacter faecitabidus]|uniref:RimJ/RimL family protein N-acetyltransferase n=1 Tax=Rarobacter faecitabidus TaxID=13243 RepID=A0A542ZW45_RARFA|nr:GNAT family protein [Rarobacter faecitabidus]TQL64577.1 RimJ/RimL family protein N-acetyltransferase [Rarobacter faecitabidus]
MGFSSTPRLANGFVALEPLSLAHRDDLADASGADDLHEVWYTHVPAPRDMGNEIVRRLAQQEAGTLAPWAIIDAASSRAVGMTTYLHLDPENRRLEIGSTWLARSAQGTAINPAAKLLLLTRAFEDLGCMAVELRTHWHNHQSRRAIEKLGAKQDGVLRQHVLFENGTVRDTVVYSILDNEWPTVKFALTERLRRFAAPR